MIKKAKSCPQLKNSCQLPENEDMYGRIPLDQKINRIQIVHPDQIPQPQGTVRGQMPGVCSGRNVEVRIVQSITACAFMIYNKRASVLANERMTRVVIG